VQTFIAWDYEGLHT